MEDVPDNQALADPFVRATRIPGHPGSTDQTVALAYEIQLDRDPRWAFYESSRHFEEKSAVFGALRKIALRLKNLNISYAVVGGMALFKHGLRRYTEDVNILVTRGDLKKIHDQLEGLGYLPPHRRSKHLRDTELGVRIELLTSGEYPGDGLVKPVVFPEPGPVSFESDGVSYVSLPTLIELKIASGMTNPGRRRDLADVLELIKILNLTEEFSTQLNPFVREQYRQLCKEGRKRYVELWRNKWLTAHAKTLDEMTAALRAAADHLEAMRKDGVTLDPDGGTGDDYAHLVTTDPEVAKKYDVVEESEYWGDDEDDLDDGGEESGGEGELTTG